METPASFDNCFLRLGYTVLEDYVVSALREPNTERERERERQTGRRSTCKHVCEYIYIYAYVCIHVLTCAYMCV